VQIGIAMFRNVDAPAPGHVRRMIEDRGLDWLWPGLACGSPSTPTDGSGCNSCGAGGGGPQGRYFKTFERFVAMTAAAAARTR
jgi:hypothetical protein